VFDIYSNSWGYRIQGRTFAGLSDASVDAIEAGATLVCDFSMILRPRDFEVLRIRRDS